MRNNMPEHMPNTSDPASLNTDLPVPRPRGERLGVVLVTGAAKRLGRDIAVGLAAQGWDVAVHCHTSLADAEQTRSDIQALGRQCCVLQADLADEAATQQLIAATCAQLQQVDAVVNNASVFEFDAADSFSYAMLDKHMRTNVAPAIVLAQALAKHIRGREQAEGVVVNLLDQKLWNPNPDFLSYTLSKAALESANTLLAQSLAPHVRVVGVAPGLTLTSPWLQGQKFDQAHQLSPLGRSSTPTDVVQAVAFALQNRALTGSTLLVDGGQHLQRFTRDFSMM